MVHACIMTTSGSPTQATRSRGCAESGPPTRTMCPRGVRDVNDVTAMVAAKVVRELLGLLMTG